MATSLAVSLEKGLKATFIEQMKNETSLVDSLCTVVPSSSRSEKYAWLGESPSPKVWPAGQARSAQDLAEASYTLENQRFEATIDVSRLDIDDDQLGALPMRIKQMAQRAAQHKSKLVMDAINAGEAAACYDGAAFFSDAHPDRGGGVQSNLLAGSGTTASAISSDLSAAIAAMKKLKDEQGEPLHGDGPGGLTVICSPDLERAFTEVLEATILSSSGNVMVNKAALIASPRMAGNDWVLAKTGGIVRGMIFQDRDPITFSALESSSEQGFKTESYSYGVRYRAAVGYAHFGNMLKVKQ